MTVGRAAGAAAVWANSVSPRAPRWWCGNLRLRSGVASVNPAAIGSGVGCRWGHRVRADVSARKSVCAVWALGNELIRQRVEAVHGAAADATLRHSDALAAAALSYTGMSAAVDVRRLNCRQWSSIGRPASWVAMTHQEINRPLVEEVYVCAAELCAVWSSWGEVAALALRGVECRSVPWACGRA
jgi:hypothetical protein